MLVVDVQNDYQNEQFQFPDGSIEFGRIPDPTDCSPCVVNDPHVSKRQLRIELISENLIRLRNLSQTTHILLEDGTNIVMGDSREARLPLHFAVGKTRVWMKQLVPQPVSVDQTLPPDIFPPFQPQMGMGMGGDLAGGGFQEESPFERQRDEKERARLQTVNVPKRGKGVEVLSSLGDSPSPEKLASWFETVIEVQRSAASSAEFYQHTAKAVVELIGLDVGLVLLLKGNNWDIVGRHATNRGEDMSFSRTTLKFVVEERRTFYHGFGDDSKVASRSLQDAKAVVASPIFDENNDKVVGVVYGSASLFGFGRSAEIRPLEAQVVQVLAAAVGVGMARMVREAEASRRRVQFEQFFSPVLMRELDRDPNMLEGRDREVTMVFTDIRKFSLLSEQLGPKETCRLVRDVMERLTTQVVDYNGVVIDYYGDGMCAMWNAPAEIPNHASVACKAALSMLKDLPLINAEWEKIIGKPVGIGVGVNTGHAQVGNIGSQRKFKYGAMGKAVNLASRVEGATKHMGAQILVSRTTRDMLSAEFNTRRLGLVKVVGASDPLELFELLGPEASEAWHLIRRTYETALGHFEAGRFQECRLTLEPLVSIPEPDLPSQKLSARATHLLTHPPEHFDGVIELESK